MLKTEDIKVVKLFGKVEWLLLCGIMTTLSGIVFCAVLIVQSI